MEKSCRKCTPKDRSRPLFNFGNNPKQPLNARNSFKNKTFLKEDYQKAFKKLILFFLLSPVPFNR